MKSLLILPLLVVSFFTYSQSLVPGGTQISFVLNKDIFAPDVNVGEAESFSVSQEVMLKGKVVIPANAKVRATITEVAKGGPHQGESRLKVQIYDVVAADGSTVTLDDCYVFTMGDGGHKQRGALLLKGIGKNCIVKK